MPDYRRADQPGGTFFLTIVTYNRRPLFADAATIGLLRGCIRQVRSERPFDINAAVVLPDHSHVIRTLPNGDADFSSRVGRMKVLFTKAFRGEKTVGSANPTRLKSWLGTSSLPKQGLSTNLATRQAFEPFNAPSDIVLNSIKRGSAACRAGLISPNDV